MILVTGGAGFIGSHFIVEWIKQSDEKVINLDLLTYAANLDNLRDIPTHKSAQHVFSRGNINNSKLVKILLSNGVRAVINFAAESHVDRSIADPDHCFYTNTAGTLSLLNSALEYWERLSKSKKDSFRFLQISTDEVYGSLDHCQPPTTENYPYLPTSPYAASKASADHLVRSYNQTYGLPTLITHCSNNYGTNQYPEKLIPLTIKNALSGSPITIHGDGQHIRDWLNVADHCSALRHVLEFGKTGESYNIGANSEKTNIEIVRKICSLLDELKPKNGTYHDQIEYINDRLVNDRRYAIDASKLRALGWQPVQLFEDGLRKTVEWYVKKTSL